MTVKLDAWMDELIVNVPGAGIVAAKLALQGALAEFLRRSGAYWKEIPGITLRDGRDTYTIPKQPEGPILFVYAMMYKNRPLHFVPLENWVHLTPQVASEPHSFRRYSDELLRFTVFPAPAGDKADKVIPVVAFGYSKKCQDNLPDVFEQHWYETLLSGAIYKLCSQQSKPYTDMALAAAHGRLFRAGIATARDQARKQFTRSETPFRFPAWA